jgi:hypothetical protein
VLPLRPEESGRQTNDGFGAQPGRSQKPVVEMQCDDHQYRIQCISSKTPSFLGIVVVEGIASKTGLSVSVLEGYGRQLRTSSRCEADRRL